MLHTLVFKIKYPATGEVLNLVNVSQDNTNRKRAEKALQEVNKKLNLLSSITRHDIINQVTAAEMFVDIMEMESTAVGRLATLARKSNRSYLLPPQ